MAGSLHLARRVCVAQEVPRCLSLDWATFHGDHRGTSLREAEGRVPERKGYMYVYIYMCVYVYIYIYNDDDHLMHLKSDIDMIYRYLVNCRRKFGS